MRKLLVFISFLSVLSLLNETAYAQIPLAGYIKPLGGSDAYPTHIDSLQKGGYRIAKDTVERNIITSMRRKVGMMVYVIDIDSMYILKGGIANSNWTTYTSSSSTVTAVGNATSAATKNTIVLRDGNSDFAAGTITAALNGNAKTADLATIAGTLNQPSQTEITSVGSLIGLTVLSDIVGNLAGNAATATLAVNATHADLAYNVEGTIALANGGTGAGTAAAAKTNLGLNHVDNTADSTKPISNPVKTALTLKENTNNKNTNTALGNSDTYFPTQNAVKAYVDGKVASGAPDATPSVKGKIRLNGDITGSADSVLIASVGGRSATDIGIATGLAIFATNDATGSTLVKRNPSGDFSAGMITANLTGLASRATDAINADNAKTAGTADNVTGIVILGNGGTGATTAADARVKLELGNVNNTSDIDKPVSTAVITALVDKVSISTMVGHANGVASLDINGLVPTAQIPPISFTSVKVVNTEAEMLGLSDALVGSVVIRMDNSMNYVLSALPPSTTGNWLKLLSTGGSNVISVNGKIGTVSLTAADLNLGAVQNTADINKVVSTPTLTALNLKENLSNKSTVAALGINDLLYPSQHAVKTYVDTTVLKGTKDATTSATGKIRLGGDLSGTASLPTVASVGGSTAANINNATIAANAATYSLAGLTIVKRDASGNFAAGTITADIFNGKATNAANADNATTAGTATNVSGIVDVVNGGTGASDPANARANLVLNNIDNTSDAAKPLSDADIAALLLKVNTDIVGQPSGLATLGADGKVPTTQIPPMSFTTVQVVGDKATMLSLPEPVLIGSVVIRTDNNKNYVLAKTPASDSTNWVELRSTGGSNVQSVAGRIGNVTVNKNDVGLGNVDNTADLNKPVSSWTTAELNKKENSINKSLNGLLGVDDALYPTQHAVKTYVDNKVATGVADATISATGKIQLTGDLGGTATSPKIANLGGFSAASIASATALVIAATDQNGVGTIVKRDGSGNFSGTLIGTATNVTGMVVPANGGTGVATTTKAYVFAGPSLTDGAPAFRPLIASDFPDLSGAYLPLVGGNLSGALTGTSAAFTSESVTGALTAGTYNSLTLSPSSAGFTVAGGTISKTLTVTDNTTLGGSNTGDVTLAGQGYLTLGTGAAGQQITAGLINVNTQITGILAASAFPALSGDVSTSAGLLATTITANAINTAKIQDGSVTLVKMGNISASKLLGNASGGIAAVSEIILGTGLSFSGSTLNTTNSGAVTSISGIADRISINNTTTVPAIDIASTYIGQPSITTVGTITIGSWTGEVVAPAFGGTGIANGSKTITLGGNLVTTGAYSTNFTTTGTTALTLPETGVLATLDGTEVLHNKTIDGTFNTLINIDATKLTGTLDGLRFPAFSGDVVTTAGKLVTAIANNVVTNGKLAAMATKTLKGNNTSNPANPIDLTSTEVTAMLDNFTSSFKGLTPPSTGGVANFLRADGNWAAPSGVGDMVLGGTQSITGAKTFGAGNLIIAGSTSGATILNATAVAGSGTVVLPTTGTLATLAGSEALTGKTINGLTPAAVAIGFTIAGGATPKTLTVPLDASVSGTNTGDQTITLTGDVTGSGTGSFATTLANTAVIANTYGDALTVPSITVDAKGRITGVTSKIIAGVSPIGSSLTNGNIWVGSLSGLAASVAMTGDVTINNLGATVVGKINGVSLGGLTDGILKNTTSTGVPTIAVAGTDYIAPFGSLTANWVYASPDGAAGLPGFRALVGADLPGGSGSYIANGTAQQATSNFNISGNGVIGGTLNKIVISTPATTATLTLANNSALITAGAFATTLTSSATTVLTLPTSGTLATLAGTETLTNKSIDAGQLAGTIIGARFPAFTGGDVTTPAGSLVTTIVPNAVTYAKMQNVTPGKLIGNSTGVAAVPSEIAVGSGLSLSAGILSSTLAGGSVTTISVAPANGFTGSVTAASTAPVITMATSISGMIKGNAGALTAAIAGTDYIAPFGTQTANYIFAGPVTGVSTVPGFRQLVVADLPSLSANYINNSSIQQATSNFNISGNGVIGGTLNKVIITTPAATATLAIANNSSFITAGAYSTTLTSTNTTAVTLPTGGTLATLAGIETLTGKSIDAGQLTGPILGARLPAFTGGDVTTPAGSTVTTIAPLAVTYAKMQNVTASRLIGNPTIGSTTPSEISVGSGLSLSTLGVLTSTFTGAASTLATARAINGVNFDGSAAITVPVNSVNDVATSSAVYPLWTTAAGNTAASISLTKLSFMPLTGVLTATGFAGPLSGNATTATTATTATSFGGSLVGDVTGTQDSTIVGKINGVSLASLATGILKNTTGVPSIAVAGTDYVAPFGSPNANYVFASPNGSAGAPTFRALTSTDLPSLSTTYINNSSSQQTGNFNINGAGTIGGALTVNSSAISTNTTTGALIVVGGVGVKDSLHVGGSIVATGNVTAFSDIRLKKNIHTLPSVSESLRKIDAVEFDRKDIKAHQIGFIAQNVQKYFPSLISVAKDSMSTLSLNYQSMTSPLLKGWQEHDEIISKQQKEIDGLKKELELLKKSQEELIKLIKSKK